MSLWSRLFGRKPEPPRLFDRRESNDWKAGDLAVCIGNSWEPGTDYDPVIGDVLRVAGVHDMTAAWDRLGVNVRSYYLSFEGKPAHSAWCYTGFRKAVEDREPAEAEFKALIKRPVRQPEKVS